MDTTTIQPRGSQVLVKRTNVGALTSDIIILPDKAIKYNSLVGEVLKVGPGDILSNGEREPMPFKVGQKVIGWPGYGQIVKEDGKEILLLLDSSEIEAILEDE